jgi:hypothetical protein
MKRVLIFILLGPAFGVLVSSMIEIAVGRSVYPDLEGIVMVFSFGMMVSLGAMLIDACLSKFLPLLFRASVAVVTGATIPIALELAFLRKSFPFEHWIEIAMTGALCMFACSLLSNSYRADAAKCSSI